jgi:hypothetical protein
MEILEKEYSKEVINTHASGQNRSENYYDSEKCYRKNVMKAE